MYCEVAVLISFIFVRGTPLTGHMAQAPLASALPYAWQCDAEGLLMEQLAALDVQEAEATAPRHIKQEELLMQAMLAHHHMALASAVPYVPPHRR